MRARIRGVRFLRIPTLRRTAGCGRSTGCPNGPSKRCSISRLARASRSWSGRWCEACGFCCSARSGSSTRRAACRPERPDRGRCSRDQDPAPRGRLPGDESSITLAIVTRGGRSIKVAEASLDEAEFTRFRDAARRVHARMQIPCETVTLPASGSFRAGGAPAHDGTQKAICSRADWRSPTIVKEWSAVMDDSYK